MRYTKNSSFVEAKVEKGQLFVRYSNSHNGLLQCGGRRNRIICQAFSGTIADARSPYNFYGVTAIDRLIAMDQSGLAKIVRHGTKIN